MAPLHRSVAPQPQPQPHGAIPLQIQHFTHQHLLQKVFMGFQFNCDGCNTTGHGLRYRCSACDFDLHEQCATSPHRLSSYLHPHHHLILVNRPANSHVCHVCRGFTNGLSYTCCELVCVFDVHPLCTQNSLNPCQQQGGVTWGQPMTAALDGENNHQYHHHQQQQQGMPFGGSNGMNNNQPAANQQYQYQKQQQGQGMMMNHYQNQQQQQGQGQGMMLNHYQQQQQQQGQGMMLNHYQQQQGMLMNQQQQQQQGRSNNYSKVGKIAANILMTSLIGVPLNFSSKK